LSRKKKKTEDKNAEQQRITELKFGSDGSHNTLQSARKWTECITFYI